VPFSAAEQAAANAKYPGGAQQIIWAAGPIAIEYKVAGVSNLKLSPATLASIFAGKIKTWKDPAIAADNSGTTLPSAGIQAVQRHRQSRRHGEAQLPGQRQYRISAVDLHLRPRADQVPHPGGGRPAQGLRPVRLRTGPVVGRQALLRTVARQRGQREPDGSG